MPYVIAAIIIVIGAIIFTVFRTPTEAPATTETPTETTRTVDEETEIIAVAQNNEPDTDRDAIDTAEVTPTNPETTASTGVNGSFSGEASYSTGRQVHELDVTLTLENDIVVAADIAYDGAGEPPTATLKRFDDAYESEVIGKDIDTISLSRVGGASWTSDAYNEAIAEIRAQL